MTGRTGVLHYGSGRVSATAHTTADLHGLLGDRLRIASSVAGPAGARSIPAAEVEVAVEETSGDVELRALPSGEVLGSFARDWVVWHAMHPFVFHEQDHTPRFRLGSVVVQRESWVVAAEALGDTVSFGPSLVSSVARLRERLGLPRWVFIRPAEGIFRPTTIVGRAKDRKPVCIDLESILGIELLGHWMTKYERLEVTEMLPRPSELWWQEAPGRYSFEIRGLIQPARS